MSEITLSPSIREFIHTLAALPDGRGKHAAFIYGVLREPIFDTALMSAAMETEPLTEDAMLHIAANYYRADPRRRAAITREVVAPIVRHAVRGIVSYADNLGGRGTDALSLYATQKIYAIFDALGITVTDTPPERVPETTEVLACVNCGHLEDVHVKYNNFKSIRCVECGCRHFKPGRQ